MTRRLLLGAVLLIAVGLLAGCAGGSAAQLTGTSWPGISHLDDTLYVAYGPQVHAVDVENGRRLWSYPAEPTRSRTFFAAPAVTEGLIIVSDYQDMLTALDPTNGGERWSFRSTRSRFIGGTVIGDRYVYAGTVDGVMHALDRETGTEVWTFSSGRDIWSTPLLDGDTLYFTSLDRHLYALDAATGNLKWQFPPAGETADPPVGPIVGTPTLTDGLLVFGSFNNTVYAINAQTQQVQWTYQTTNWVWSSPVFDEATGLLIGGDLDGRVFALDPETGSAVWTFNTGGPVVGVPAIAELDGQPVAYIASADSRVYALNTGDGSQVVAPVSIEAEFTSRFLFFPTGTSVRPIPLYSSPLAVGDLLIVGAHQGNYLLYALDCATLLERWKFEAASS
mgnify:CR=1 FL=1